MTQLPRGWILSTIGEIARVETGNTPPKKDVRFYGAGYPFFKPGDLDRNDLITSSEEQVTEEGARVGRLLPCKTLLVSCIGNLGKSALTDIEAICNQQINAVLPTEAATPEYLLYWSRTIRGWLEENSSATTIQIINKSRFSAAPIALAPAKEQRRIAARISSLSAKSRRTRGHLDTLPVLIEKYKNAILSAALQGKLPLESQNYSCTRWRKVSIGQIAEITSGYGFPKDRQGKIIGKYPFAKVSDISRAVASQSGLLWTATNWIDDADLTVLKARPVPEGSIVFAKIGEALRLNRRAVTQCPLVLDNNCMALTPDTSQVEPQFLYRKMQTVDLNPFAVATSVPSVRRGDVADIVVNLPPINEQRSIVNSIDNAFSWIDRIAVEATSARKLIDRLDQAILSKAFCGELVPQDPNDEPASVLLERINGEKNGAVQPRKGRGRPPSVARA